MLVSGAQQSDIDTHEVKSLSRVRLFAIPWTVAYLAPPSRGFSRQEYWSGLPFPSPWDLSNPGIEPRSPTLQEDFLLSEPPAKLNHHYYSLVVSFEIKCSVSNIAIFQVCLVIRNFMNFHMDF